MHVTACERARAIFNSCARGSLLQLVNCSHDRELQPLQRTRTEFQTANMKSCGGPERDALSTQRWLIPIIILVKATRSKKQRIRAEMSRVSTVAANPSKLPKNRAIKHYAKVLDSRNYSSTCRRAVANLGLQETYILCATLTRLSIVTQQQLRNSVQKSTKGCQLNGSAYTVARKLAHSATFVDTLTMQGKKCPTL